MKTMATGRRCGGFTLIEVGVAIAIVAIGVAALMVGVASSTQTNSASRQLSQAVLLAQDLREWTIKLPFWDPEDGQTPLGPEAGEYSADDLDDLHGQTFCPPRDAMGYQIYEMTDWSQQITMNWVDPTDFSTVSVTPTDVVSVQVTVSNDSVELLSTGWVVTRRE